MSLKSSLVFALPLLLCATLTAAPAPKKAAKTKKGNADVELFANQKNKISAYRNLLPPGVKTIACISPGSYPGKVGYKRGIEILRKAGYNVKVLPNAFAKPPKGAKSVPLAQRLSDFLAAWNDPEVDMIYCIRGGWGCAELMQNVNWSKLPRRKNLYVQGYSDVTMILCALQKRGYGYPVAGPMVGAMTGLHPTALADMKAMHNGKAVGPINVIPLVKGDRRGLPLAGLLTRLALAAKGSDRPITKDRIIFIESVSIKVPKIRECMQTLLDEKFFDGAAAVVFCSFIRTGDDKGAEALLKEFAPKLGVPVYMGFPFGHNHRSRTIDFQREVVIKNNQVYFPAPAK